MQFCKLALALTVLWCSPIIAHGDDPIAVSRANVIRTLQSLSDVDSPKWMLGQNVGHGSDDLPAKYQSSFGKLEQRYGTCPKMLGLDLGYEETPRSNKTLTRIAKQHAQRGGVVTISLHPKSVFGGGLRDVSNRRNFREIFRKGSMANLRWFSTLDRVAAQLQVLQDQGVIVLWRPLHEMNGGWFWWCPKSDGKWLDKKDFIQLWRESHDYLVQKKRLRNLIWVYSAAVQTDPTQKSATHYYPGDAYVDVVGLDYYSNTMDDLDAFGSYSKLAELGKPIGLTEVGPGPGKRDGSFDAQNVAALMARHRRLGFVLFWHSWENAKVAIADISNNAALVKNPNAMTMRRQN